MYIFLVFLKEYAIISHSHDYARVLKKNKACIIGRHYFFDHKIMDIFDNPLTRSMYDPLCATLVIILFWKSYDIMFPTRHDDGQTSGERTFVDYNDGGPVLRKFCNCVMYLNVIRLFYYVVMNNRDINECPFSREYWKYDELQTMFAVICVSYTIYLYFQIKTIEDDDICKK